MFGYVAPVFPVNGNPAYPHQKVFYREPEIFFFNQEFYMKLICRRRKTSNRKIPKTGMWRHQQNAVANTFRQLMYRSPAEKF